MAIRKAVTKKLTVSSKSSKKTAKKAAKKVSKKITKKISKKVTKVNDNDPALAAALSCATICEEKRAADITILDVRGICDFTDYYVIATTQSLPQTRAVMKDIIRAMVKIGVKPLSGKRQEVTSWSLVDLGDVFVHLFSREMRDFYRLEELLSDAPVVKLPKKR